MMLIIVIKYDSGKQRYDRYHVHQWYLVDLAIVPGKHDLLHYSLS
jgi:hypothetical protein